MFPTTWYQIHYQTAKIGTILWFWKSSPIWYRERTMQEKVHVALYELPKWLLALGILTTVHAVSWPVHTCTGIFESEQLECFEAKRSVIDTRTPYGSITGMCEYSTT